MRLLLEDYVSSKAMHSSRGEQKLFFEGETRN